MPLTLDDLNYSPVDTGRTTKTVVHNEQSFVLDAAEFGQIVSDPDPQRIFAILTGGQKSD